METASGIYQTANSSGPGYGLNNFQMKILLRLQAIKSRILSHPTRSLNITGNIQLRVFNSAFPCNNLWVSDSHAEIRFEVREPENG
jgi:hypothetical protein